jgi:hypothetical protein
MIVPARECHVCQMVTSGLRAADIEEARAALGLDPMAALHLSWTLSKPLCWAAVDEVGRPYAMFGVADTRVPNLGCPWLIATDDLRLHARELLRETKRFIPLMRHFFPRLENRVDARHAESIRWLKWAGFKFTPPEPFGPEGKPFHRFYMEP